MDSYFKKLEQLSGEYHELYIICNRLDTYSTTYLTSTSYHYGITYTVRNLKQHLERQLETVSLQIRKNIVTDNAHYEMLIHVNKDIKCGLKQYQFRSKYKKQKKSDKLFQNKYVPTDIKRYICSFLGSRDAFSLKLSHAIPNPYKYEHILDKMTLSQLRNLPYVFTYRWETFNSIKTCMDRVRKSSKKKDLIDEIVNNINKLASHFRGYTISQEIIQSIDAEKMYRYSYESIEEKLCGSSYSDLARCSLLYDSYYIPTEYASEYLQILKILDTHAYEMNQHIKNKKAKLEKEKKNKKDKKPIRKIKNTVT